MPDPDYRALCAELVDKIEGMVPFGPDEEHLTNRAIAALAQPETVAPTDEELEELYFDFEAGHVESWRHFVRAVLARWGQP